MDCVLPYLLDGKKKVSPASTTPFTVFKKVIIDGQVYLITSFEELIFISICLNLDQYFISCSDKTKFLSLCENIKFFLSWWIFAFFQLLL